MSSMKLMAEVQELKREVAVLQDWRHRDRVRLTELEERITELARRRAPGRPRKDDTADG